jgi:ribonuclease P protein component
MKGNRAAGLRWITKSRQIRLARKEGIFFRSEHLFAWVSAESFVKSDHPAVAIVFRRGFKRAVDRNLVRRRVRGCIMEARDLLEPGCVYLIECKPGAETVDYQILVKEVQSLISRDES